MEHRLGIVGKWVIPDHLVQRASDYGLRLEKARISDGYEGFYLYTIDAENDSGIRPSWLKDYEAFDEEKLRDYLGFLHAPIDALAARFANETINTKNPDIIPQALHDVRKRDAEKTRQNFHQFIGFLTQGTLNPVRVQHDDFDDYHEDHDDECECISEDLEETEALQNDSEVFGRLLPGFLFDKKSGKFSFHLHKTISHPHFHTPALKKLYETFRDNLHEVTEDRFKGHHHKITLSAEELEDLFAHIHDALIDDPNLLMTARQEENVIKRHEAANEKRDLSTQSPSHSAVSKYDEDMTRNAQNLGMAAQMMAEQLNSEQMRKIWRKFNISRTFLNENNQLSLSRGLEHEELDAVIESFESLKADLDAALQTGSANADTLNAIMISHADTMATGQHLSNRLAWILNTDNATKQTASVFESAADTFKNSAFTSTQTAKDFLGDDQHNAVHYLGRHLGLDHINFARSFSDFANDFGGEIVNFYKKYPASTTLGIFLASQFIAGNAPDTPALPSIDSTGFVRTVIDGKSILIPISETSITTEQLSKFTCHWHVKFLGIDHCLVSDQAMVQMEDAVKLFKTPMMSTINGPADIADAIAQWRGPDAPPFQFAEGFTIGLSETGEVLFVANQYQNLAHAPWFGIAATMGARLGVAPALAKTSVLVTPVIDAGWALSREKPLVGLGALALASNGWYAESAGISADGSTIQGLSGVISGTIYGGLLGYGAHGAINFMRNKTDLLDQKRTGRNRALNIAGSVEGFTTLGDSGLLVPENVAEELRFPQDKEISFDFDLAGGKRSLTVNRENYDSITQSLHKFLYTLDVMPEKIGIDPEEENWYLDDLKNSAKNLLGDFESYRTLHDFNQYELIHGLKQNLETVIAAQWRHQESEALYSSLAGTNLTDRPKKDLSIKAAQHFRSLRTQAWDHDDSKSLQKLFTNAGRMIKFLPSMPITASLNYAWKAATALKIAGKTILRTAWEEVRRIGDILSLSYNSLSDKTKGHLVAGGIGVAALAVGTDAIPALQTALEPWIGAGGVDTIKTGSHIIGHGVGGATATGLFGIYNFGEDHLFVHVGLGYMFIVGAGTVAMAYALGNDVIVKPLSVAAEELKDATNVDLRMMRHGRNLMNSLTEATKNVTDFDTRFLDKREKTHDHHPECCDHTL